MAGALDDVRVLDLTHILNGPFCTMLLGHLGAEIIKIEPPDGDSFRRIWMAPGAPVDGYEFMAVNANKKSVVINLKTDAGRDLLRRLVAVSDVLVENFGKGTMEAFGLDYEAVRQINPRLIYACSRGYGETGPYAAYGSNAGVNNGMTGWTATAWQYGQAPGTKALGIGDEAAGVSMALGILAALHARARTGVGQKIEVAMQEAVLGFMVSTHHEYFTGNQVGGPPTQVADGYFTLRLPELSDANWRQLTTVMERPDLTDDPRFATRTDRTANRAALSELLFAWAHTQTRQQLWDKLRDLGYVGAPVHTLDEVFADPHLEARQAFIQQKHPAAGDITLVAPWIRLSETPASIRQPSPALGEHTSEVLQHMLGCEATEVAALQAAGVVR